MKQSVGYAGGATVSKTVERCSIHRTFAKFMSRKSTGVDSGLQNRLAGFDFQAGLQSYREQCGLTHI